MNQYKFKARDKKTKPLLPVIQTLKCTCIRKMHLTSPGGIFFSFRRLERLKKPLMALYVMYMMSIIGFLLIRFRNF